MEPLNIGIKLKTLRELHGIKQDDIAQRLGISQNAYSKLETGETDITLKRLEEIAKIYNMKFTDLFNFDPQNIIHQITSSSKATSDADTFVNIGNNTINQTTPDKQDLYERYIQQQQEEIKFLKEMIEHLKKNV